MRFNKVLLILVAVCFFIGLRVSVAQELNATVTVAIPKLQETDPAVFKTLERDLQEFLKQEHWTEDEYKTYERIDCNFSVNITQELGGNAYKADIALKAIRPVYGSEYKTVLINHVDRDIVFNYQEFQPIENGTLFFKDNLSAVFSFYVHFILGLSAESYSSGAGDEQFQLAQNILSQVPPQIADIDKGWQSLNKKTTRYWMVENMLNARFKSFNEAWYNYHRKSLDIMYTNLDLALNTMVEALKQVDKTNTTYPVSFGVLMFVAAKGDEIVEIFKNADRTKKTQVYDIMRRLDPAGAAKYNALRN
jgi:Domain of unknown function (DUF4835)